ncbi:CDP-glycerol glycerophosphotransferase family protein [Vibrio alginolyticus]|jgi:hypothetical protein|uniref:CDP-glycerol glycerophosphotransferase family protein n=1 Tax=unclassified Vibrio TaxID=2614977 RepID=UPI001482333D|nr:MULTISPECIES: CDP-glycerol glycerophosphotransferase family protein [unclassified Vibrio]MDW1799668.1 CDP-glycerol glycerophosphotransferase family protein [Vibrio sp. Vb2201]NNN51832.1 CDP-glycerol--glycerophosphate glycerophosphotransferase [Vibrio sp. 2-2(7)]NNN90115.1 CDP-glycerol--glycerophosphate glycerophosphotransferase [Vibrio sp. 2-2(9)]
MRVAFLIWNKFQFKHFSKFYDIFDDITLIIERRLANDSIFSVDQLADMKMKKLFIDKSKIKHLDGVFDVIFCQTVFPQIEYIEKSKIAMLQYGLAKENHNYGTWRSFASVIFSYGNYSTEKLSHFAPTFNIGHPKFDKLSVGESSSLKETLKLDNLKKTILYCPTWGDLSSYPHYIDEILSKADDYNVILKLHHNTLTLSDVTNDFSDSHVIVANDYELSELIQVSDVVISDYSGAIFDAVYCDKPIVLCHHLDLESMQHDKVGLDSLEFKCSERLGVVVNKPKELSIALEKALHNPIDTHEIKNDLFVDLTHDEFVSTIKHTTQGCVLGNLNKTQGQRFVSDLVRHERKQKFALKKAMR